MQTIIRLWIPTIMIIGTDNPSLTVPQAIVNCHVIGTGGIVQYFVR